MSIQYTTDEQIERMRQELSAAKKKAESIQAHKFLYAQKVFFKIFGHVLFYATVAALLFVLVSVLVTKSRGNIPSIFGYQLFVVESGSMSPTLEVGTVILSKAPKDAAALTTGDIITFKAHDDAVVTHRIIGVLQGDDGSVAYRTKGDNPINSPDVDPVRPENVLAVFLLKIPFT